MLPIRELADDIYRERVLRARRTPPEEKFLDGARLFDYACRITLAGIRHQHPEADETRVQQILAERIARERRLDESRYGLYVPYDPSQYDTTSEKS